MEPSEHSIAQRTVSVIWYLVQWLMRLAEFRKDCLQSFSTGPSGKLQSGGSLNAVRKDTRGQAYQHQGFFNN